MQIQDRIDKGILVLSLAGRLDHAGAETFRDVANQWAARGHRALLVDFQGVTFLSSMGIRALMEVSQALTRGGGRMALTGLSVALTKLLENAGLHRLFTIFPSAAEATDSDIWPPAP